MKHSLESPKKWKTGQEIWNLECQEYLDSFKTIARELFRFRRNTGGQTGQAWHWTSRWHNFIWKWV